MEDERIQLVRRLTESRAELLNDYPFFGRLLMNIRFGTAKCGTAFTDTKRIVFDPRFAGRLSDDELRFVLMHEVMHCALKHCTRGKGLIHSIFNIACDIVVNSNILSCLGLKDFEVDGECAMHLTPDGKEGCRYSAEEVYEMLIKPGASIPVKNSKTGKTDRISVDDMETMDTHEPWSAISDAMAGDKWDKLIGQYGSNYSEESFPPSVRKLYEELRERKSVRWKDILYDFIDENYDDTDYSFSPPERRFSDYRGMIEDYDADNLRECILPGENNIPSEIIQNIWFLVDTSGSIGEEQLKTICGEMLNIFNEVTGIDALLSFFDTNISEPKSFTSREEFININPVGGGGTSFSNIFKYMRENMQDNLPVAIVILTDGYAAVPDESEACSVPVLWLLIGECKDMPWGRTVRIE